MDDTKTKLNTDDGIDKDKHEDDVDLSYNGEQPERKILRLDVEDAFAQLSLNTAYDEPKIKKWLQTAWNSKENDKVLKDEETDIEVYTEPFQICLLPELLQTTAICKDLVKEMVDKVRWSRKQMDLYEFFQSTDLSNMTQCRLLSNFLQMLRRCVRPWLEEITQLKLDYVSASCSLYTCGDYLLVHDDLLKDRQIAFIYYLSPWDGVEEWSEAQGGCLEIFNSDAQGFPQFPVAHKISPKNNRFAFFKVGSRSFHQVGEVTNFDYPRMTINGWFHGASNADPEPNALRPFTRLNFKQPSISGSPALGRLLNEVYLKAATRRSIQKRIEDNSEICLYEFFKREIFELALTQLLNDDTLKWTRRGPANAHNYEVLDLNALSGTVAQLLHIFESNEMFELLRHFTDLDLYGVDAITPTCSVEIQRWTHGNYTVLGDGVICEDNTLDLIYYLNASEGAAVITYLSPDTERKPEEKDDDDDEVDSINEMNDEDDESILLTIHPVDNALNIVYRCEGTTKFTKYVSHNTALDKGPVFVISSSYKE